MAPDHRRLLSEQNQNLEDLQTRNPRRYREIEEKQRRLNFEASMAVAMSPTHVRKAEALS